MKPAKKTPSMTDALNRLTGRSKSIEENTCVRPPFGCGGPAKDFKNALSEREFSISGLCQKCQNEVFRKE